MFFKNFDLLSPLLDPFMPFQVTLVYELDNNINVVVLSASNSKNEINGSQKGLE